MKSTELNEIFLTNKITAPDLSLKEMLEDYALERKRKIEAFEKLKHKTDEFIFVIGGKDYKKYIDWRHSIETRINIQELETGKRKVDGKKLSESDLNETEKYLEQGKVKVEYGGYGLHYFDGHEFRFNLHDSSYSISVLNKLTKDTISLGKGYFYRFSDYYQSVNKLVPEIRMSLFEKMMEIFFDSPSSDFLTKTLERDCGIHEKWKELTEYSYSSGDELDRLIFRIGPEQLRIYQAWRDEESVTDCYFSFEDTNFGSLDSAVNSITRERIDLTDTDSW